MPNPRSLRLSPPLWLESAAGAWYDRVGRQPLSIETGSILSEHVRAAVIVVALAGLWPGLARISPAATPIECIANTAVSAKLADRSKLHGKLADGTPASRLGAWGSAIAYTGRDDLYVVAPDRGPNTSTHDPSIDNTTSYQARIETVRIAVNSAHTHAVSVTFVETLLLTNEDGSTLHGLSTGFTADQPSDFVKNRRIDPEGLRVSCDRRHYYLSDEYGPGVFEFDAHSGRRTRIFSLPPRFAVTKPAATAAAELAGNTSGRQANHGLEGLAITPGGQTLLAILQAPLMQDTEVDARGERIGSSVRLLTIDVGTGQTREYLYQLDNVRQNGVNEILAVNDHQFLVLERDAKAAEKSTTKSLFLIDLDGASDVSEIRFGQATGGSRGNPACRQTIVSRPARSAL